MIQKNIFRVIVLITITLCLSSGFSYIIYGNFSFVCLWMVVFMMTNIAGIIASILMLKMRLMIISFIAFICECCLFLGIVIINNLLCFTLY